MKGRTVLITGGGRGIGAACVRAFTRVGARVAFLYKGNHEAAHTLAAQTGALAVCCDVSDSANVKAAFARVEEALGAVQILVCNAGVSSFGLLQDVNDEEWRRVMGCNLDGVFFSVREALPPMIRAGWGRIVLVSSIWGRVGASCEVAYSASKAGIIGLGKALAKEVGPSGITVNCVAPGVIDTDMNRALGEETLFALAEEIPLGRLGRSAEVAEAILQLCAENAGYITGQVLGVDGGYMG